MSVINPSGKQRTKSFDRKITAEHYLATISTAQQTGSWIDPRLSQVAVGHWGGRRWKRRPGG